MTADIRTAAQREAAAHLEAMREARKYAPDDIEAQHDFACGYLVADRARVTPTREQLAQEIYEANPNAIWSWEEMTELDKTWPLRAADAVLKLMQELAEGNDDSTE